ncbi:MAG: DUF3795 domain-containing protein [Clostridiales bacterium]|nr:DUF3795 domain-containing protein [Clostridiales bacterium]
MMSVCGTDCSTCYCYEEKMCNGCNEAKGKVFHMAEGKACRIYDCTVNNKHGHCGNCDKLPCDIWRSTRDPKFTDQEFDENIRERMANLKKIK